MFVKSILKKAIFETALPSLKRVLPPTLIGRIEFYEFYWHPSMRAGMGAPFNGQEGRKEIFKNIVSTCRPMAIVETGTYQATTTYFMAAHTGLPIYTVEYDSRNFGFAAEHLRGIKNVQISHGDSRSFLRRFVANSQFRNYIVFFYLDAHWNKDLPLAEEINVIFSARLKSIVLIDDFQVPGDADYGYDDFGEGMALTSDYIVDACRAFGLCQFFPSLPAKRETGEKRGCVVLASHPDAVSNLKRISSLREQS
jgi:hypothetical protein